jgi:serine/threonine protein kinase
MKNNVHEAHMTLSRGAIVRDPEGNRYVIEGLLGEGGFGAVYLVRDKHIKQNVFALKEVIDPNERDRKRFMFEGELLKRLKHRSLPRVFQVFEDPKRKRVYLLMDYIRGRDLETLREEQAEKRFSLSFVLTLMTPIVDALVYLHRQDPPIVHRDIKPANIIVQDGADAAMLVDFGSAKEHMGDATTNVIRQGSPGYAALEQYGGGTTPQTDIYGLGATLYTLLTGKVPPDAVYRAGASRRNDPLELAHLVVPDVSWGVATAIERAMNISQEDRFETVEEFWEEVKKYVLQQEEKTVPRIPVVTPRPPVLHENHSEKATVEPGHKQSIPRVSSRVVLFGVVLVLLLSLGIGLGSFAYTMRQASTARSVSTLPARPHSIVTVAPASPTVTVSPGSRLYPLLAASYGGTVADIMNNEKTAMYLTQMQQNQGSISGDFQGLGLVGLFTGSITPAGHVEFQVKDTTADVTMAFEGDIKIGGDIVGTFAILDRNGSRTGETGLWNVAASP